MKAKIGKCKNNLFVVLPKDAVAGLGWQHGDILDVEPIENGLKAVRTMTAHDHALEIADKVMEEYRETFEAFAKT